MYRVILTLSLIFFSSSAYLQDSPDPDNCVGLFLSDSSASMGELLCVDVYTSGFTNVLSFQYTLAYDPTLLAFNSCQSDAIDSYSCGDFSLNEEDAFLMTNWVEPLLNLTTLDSATVLANLCFDILQDVNAVDSVLYFTDETNLDLEIVQGDPDDLSGPLINNPPCFGGSPSIVMTDITSSTDEVFVQAVEIGPNPITDFLQIEINTQFQDVVNARIVDLGGKTVFSQPNVSAITEVNMSSVNEGIYILVLESSDHGLYSQKIFKAAN